MTYRGRSHFWAHVGALACVCLAAACASHRPRSLSDRLVRPATRADLQEDFDIAPHLAPEDDRAGGEVSLPELTPRAAASNLPTIEQLDPELASALAEAEAAPSAARLLRAGREYRRLQLFDSAYAHFRRALELSPRNAAVYDELARLWRDAGLPAIALGDAHRAVSFAPDLPGARNTLGTVFYALGKLDDAEREFTRVLELDPDAAYARSNLCYVAFLRGDTQAAQSLCEAALAAAPDLTAARNNLALVHAAAGRLAEARDAFVAAGGSAAGLYNVGIVHLARGDYAAAVDAFDAALREDPAMIDAVRRAADARAHARK